MEISLALASKDAFLSLLLNIALAMALAVPLGYPPFAAKQTSVISYGRQFAALAIILSTLGVTGYGQMPLHNFLFKFYLVAIGYGIIGLGIGILYGLFRKLRSETIPTRQANSEMTSLTDTKTRHDFGAVEKQFIVKVLVIVGSLVLLYYLFSPYQNCIRKINNAAWCIHNTSW